MKAEGDLRKAAVAALKRAGLPEDLIERTKTVPGAPFEHREAFANLSDADRMNLRKAFKDFASFPVGDFDKLTRAGDANGDGKQGKPVTFEDPEPWPERVDGAALLSGIASFIQRYVSIAPALADTVALWIVVTWIHDRLEISPFLNATSATKRCGKSILVVEVLGALVRRAHPICSKVSSAYLFRLIELHEPTLLLDEIDTYLRDEPELRGDLNSSQRRSGAYAGRLVPLRDGSHEPRRFSTWCPKVFSGISGMPDTVLDRSIVVKIARRPPGVSLTGWRDRDKRGVETMRRKLARWREDNAAVARLWEAATCADATPARVYLERCGCWPGRHVRAPLPADSVRWLAREAAPERDEAAGWHGDSRPALSAPWCSPGGFLALASSRP